MISETQTEYGVGSRCHGRSWRPCRSNQASSRSANVSAPFDIRGRDVGGIPLEREALDAIHGTHAAGRQHAFQVPRAYDRRHEEIRLHLETVSHLRATVVRLEHPFGSAVLEVALLGQRIALDPVGLPQLEALDALHAEAMPQQAAFQDRKSTR